MTTRKSKKNNNKTKKQLKNKKYKGGGQFNNSFLKYYDENLLKIQNAIEHFSGKHSMDMNIAEQFINEQLSEVRKQAARDLIENTVYITLEEVSAIIEELIIQLYANHNLNESENIYIYCGNPKKSFYFISVLALFYIRKHNFKEPTQFVNELNNNLFKEIGNNPLIILDDVAYSGSQLSTLIGDIYFDRVIKGKNEPPNIFILLIALNNFSKAKLEQVPIEKTRSGANRSYTRSPFKLLFLQDRLYTPLINKIGIERYFNVNIFFSLYTEQAPYVSIYLDHKIADEASTYKNVLLYGPIVPSNYDYEYYSNFIINALDMQYDFIPKMENPEMDILIEKFNEENNTTFTFKKTNYLHITAKLLEKLLHDDRNINKMNNTEIRFRPFINSCNTSKNLLKIIDSKEIIDCSYMLFMIPKGCIEKNDDCVISNEGVIIYLTEQMPIEIYEKMPKEIRDEMSKEDIIKGIKKNAIKISNKINSFSCPECWYKNTKNFEMMCLSE